MRNCCPRARLALRFWRGALPWRASGIAVLLRLCPCARLVSRSCRGALPWRAVGIAVLARRFSSVHVRRCVSGAALCPRARLALRFWRGAYPRFTPAVCLATNRTACDILRSYSAGSRSPFARSRGVGAVICLSWFTSGLAVSLWRSRRVTGDVGNGVTRGTGHGAGGAALVRLCAIILAL